MFSFLKICPERIERYCEIKKNLTNKMPIIKCNQLSYELLHWNETVILKRDMIPYLYRGYKIIIDNSLDIGICEIILEEKENVNGD